MPSESGSAHPRLTLLGEREISTSTSPAAGVSALPSSGEMPPTSRATAPASRIFAPEFLEQMTAVLMSIAATVAARLLLLMALLGAFTLALLTVTSPTTLTLAANAIYDCLVFLPLVILYLRRG